MMLKRRGNGVCRFPVSLSAEETGGGGSAPCTPAEGSALWTPVAQGKPCTPVGLRPTPRRKGSVRGSVPAPLDKGCSKKAVGAYDPSDQEKDRFYACALLFPKPQTFPENDSFSERFGGTLYFFQRKGSPEKSSLKQKEADHAYRPAPAFQSIRRHLRPG